MNPLYFIYFLVFTFLFFNKTFSQDYQIVKTNGVYYYTPESPYYIPASEAGGEERYIRCIRIDSIENDTGKTIFYSFPELYSPENYYGSCLYPYSWIGKKIIADTTGNNYVISFENDTLKIKTNAILGDSWEFYKYPNGSKIVATILKTDTMLILGQPDSIKTINLQYFDSLNNAQGHPANKEIIISKNYGYVKTLNFIDFPFTHKSAIIFDISGIPGDIGINNKSTYGDIYNYEIGAKIHTKNVGSTNSFIASETNKMNRILGKWASVNNDSVIYQIENYTWGYSFQGIETGYTYFNYTDTIEQTFSNLHKQIMSDIKADSSNVLPFEIPISTYDYITTYVMYINDCGILTYLDLGQECTKSGSCYYWPYFDSWEGHYSRYYVGIDIFFSHTSYELSYYCMPCNNLIYFKKGTIECGVPLNYPYGIETINSAKDLFLLSPNPNNGNFKIRFNGNISEPCEISVWDIVGKKLFSRSDITPDTEINLNVNNGIYWIVFKKGSQIYRQKFIVNK